MKVLHGAWSCSLKQINKGTIKVFDTLDMRVLQVVQKEFSRGLLQTKWAIKVIQSSNVN
jgi:hypothetical protein